VRFGTPNAGSVTVSKEDASPEERAQAAFALPSNPGSEGQAPLRDTGDEYWSARVLEASVLDFQLVSSPRISYLYETLPHWENRRLI